MASTSSSQHASHGPPPPQGPPYPPRSASLGGIPDIIPDVPVCAAFLGIYLIFAATHITILKRNLQRRHRFFFSGALFAFCTLRIATMSLRIAWSFRRTDVGLGIAAQIFVYAGTIILFLINWFFTQRIVRAQHPTWGWSQPYRLMHRLALVCLICCLLALIVAAVQQVFTLDSYTLQIDRILQLTGQTYFAAFCVGPLILTTISLAIPRKETDKFGAGRMRVNIAILYGSAIILAAGQIFRTYVTWLPPSPLRDARGRPMAPPWYLSKTCFYTFNFTTEVIVAIIYAICRVDLRFHVPDGAKTPGQYREGRNSKYYAESGSPGGTLKGKDPESVPPSRHRRTSSDVDTLVDNASSVWQLDSASGQWKRRSVSSRPGSSGKTEAATVREEDIPPLPTDAPNWPLSSPDLGLQSHTSVIPVLEHENPKRSRTNIAPVTEYKDAQKNKPYTASQYQADMDTPPRTSFAASYKTTDSRRPSASTRRSGSKKQQQPQPRSSSLKSKYSPGSLNRKDSERRRSLNLPARDCSSSTYSTPSRPASSPGSPITPAVHEPVTASPDLRPDMRVRKQTPSYADSLATEDLTPRELLRRNMIEINAAADSQDADVRDVEGEFRQFDYEAPLGRGEVYRTVREEEEEEEESSGEGESGSEEFESESESVEDKAEKYGHLRRV